MTFTDVIITAVFGLFVEPFGDPNGIGSGRVENESGSFQLFWHLEMIANWLT